VPVKDAACKNELINYFDVQWSDNSKAVQQLPDQQYLAVNNNNGHKVNAQQNIYQHLAQQL